MSVKKITFTTSSSILYAVMMIVFGVLLIVGGVNTADLLLKILVTVSGALVLGLGAFCLFNRSYFLGVTYLVIGILLIVLAWTMMWIAYLAAGIGLMIVATLGLIRRTGWVWSNVMNLVTGLFLVLLSLGVNFAWSFANILFIVIGAFLIVDGIVMLIKR